ncbi:SPW repeat domain-containing protein [Roseomonas harenae]|uniref:SPW repeat domain-containing protein n=1 Tax=Muricoccus harenae TaxID=2692566 RepID=UPI0013312BD4|nr:SPW repeat protein [Roseomonas harenae]
MRFLSTRAHGVIDYLTVILFIAAPWLFGFADGTAAQWVPVAIGVVILLSSVLTDYELSLTRMIPMPVHLGLDLLAGLLLAASPWLFGFSDRVWMPHLLLGAFEVIVSLVTRTVPDTDAQAPSRI